MKNLTILLLTLFTTTISAQNFELSTLRIGEYKIFMKKEDAEKLSKTKFQRSNDYEQKSSVSYFGEMIDITIYEGYSGENEPNSQTVQVLSTKSSKFRTNSGMGVGNTRDNLLKAYKNYPNFSMIQSFEEGVSAKATNYFQLSDFDARTELSFKLVNNVVVEVSIYLNEGC